MLESCRGVHLLTFLKWPTQYDWRSAFCSAAISTCSLLAGSRGNLARRISPNTRQRQVPSKAGSSASVTALPAVERSALKSTSGSHIGYNASPGLSLWFCKTCGTVWPVGKHRGESAVTPEKTLGLRPSRMLTQRDRWYTHTSLEQVCSVTQPRDNSSVSQCHRVSTLPGVFVCKHQKAPLSEAYPHLPCFLAQHSIKSCQCFLKGNAVAQEVLNNHVGCDWEAFWLLRKTFHVKFLWCS